MRNYNSFQLSNGMRKPRFYLFRRRSPLWGSRNHVPNNSEHGLDSPESKTLSLLRICRQQRKPRCDLWKVSDEMEGCICYTSSTARGPIFGTSVVCK